MRKRFLTGSRARRLLTKKGMRVLLRLLGIPLSDWRRQHHALPPDEYLASFLPFQSSWRPPTRAMPTSKKAYPIVATNWAASPTKQAILPRHALGPSAG